MSEKWIVTLVHGTFARGAAWCHPNSALASAIKSSVASEVEFRRFDWSGLNLHNARIEAGKNLAGWINYVEKSDPEAKHVIIAHSHGGNVVRYALGGCKNPNAVSGVVTLATPFIEVEKRDITPWSTALKWMLYAQLLWAPLFIPIVIFIYAVSEYDFEPNPFVMTPVVAFFGYAFRWFYLSVGVPGIRTFAAATHQKLFDLQGKIYGQIAPPAISGVPLLCISTRRDEANAVLSLGRRIAEIAAATQHFLFLVFVAAVLFGAGFVWIGLSGGHSDGTFFIFMTGLVATVLPFFALAQLLAVLAICKVTHGFVFGETSGLHSLLLRIVQKPKPDNWASLGSTPYDLRPRWWDVWLPLAHSLTYQDPGVAKEIVAKMFSVAPGGAAEQPASSH